MPEYLAPGVYIEEVDTGSKPIEGVSTSTSGMVGVTERGPLGVPTLITSFPDFMRQFGGYLDDRVYTGTTWYLPHAVEGFFTNGGKRLYVVRVLPDTAAPAGLILFDRGDTDDAAGATFTRFALTLAARTGAGDQLLMLSDTTGLNPAGGDWALINDGRASEYLEIAPAPTGTIAIATPIRASLFPVGTPVNGLDAGNNPVGHTTHLAADVIEGEFVLPVDDPSVFAGAVKYEIGTHPIQEIHDAVAGGVIALSVPLALEHNPTPIARPTEWADPVQRSLTAPAPHLDTITLNNRTMLAGVGQRLRLTNADGETNVGVIAAIADPRRHPGADAGQVTFAAALTHDYDAGDSVELLDAPPWIDPVAPRHLTVVPPAAANTIRLDNRTLLEGVGQRIRLTNRTTGAAPQDVMVADVPGARDRTGGPDPGDVTLSGLGVTLVINAGNVVEAEVLDPPLAEVVQPTLNAPGAAPHLARRARPGDTHVTLDSRTGIPDLTPGVVNLLRFTAHGRSEYVRIADVAGPRGAAPDAGRVTLATPLQQRYSAGTVVTLMTDDGTHDQHATVLGWDVDPGDDALVLGDTTHYDPSTPIRIGHFGAPTSEYLEVSPTPVQAALRVTTAGLRTAHRAAVPLLGRSPLLSVQAIDPGVWGNALRVVVEEEDTPLLRETAPVAPAPHTSPSVILRTVVGIESGTILEFFTRDQQGNVTTAFRQKVATVQAGNHVAFGPGGVKQSVTADMFVRSVEFQMRVELIRLNPRTNQPEEAPGVPAEVFRQLSMDPRHSRYAVKVIGPVFIDDAATPLRADGRTHGESGLIRVTDALYPDWPRDDPLASAQSQGALRPGPDILVARTPGGATQAFGLFFTGGTDDIGSIGPLTFVGTDGPNPPHTRTGIQALANIEEIAIVGVPGQTDQEVQTALLDHCDLLRYRFAVLDSEEHDSVAMIEDQRSLYDSKYGAIYYPWLRIANPFPENPRVISQISIPSSGHVMGIYARTDIERGVHKAPANEDIRGILDLEVSLTKGEQDILNPRNINAHRNFRSLNRGLRVWGARTVSSDPDWKYVNVRRVFIFVEHSIDNGTQWAVFEPNDERLWARVRRSVTDFLTTVWRNGALQGVKPEEGFFVKCDRETMTDDDINNGRLIVLVGLAVVRPAEFVIFRIGQSRRGSQLFEGT